MKGTVESLRGIAGTTVDGICQRQLVSTIPRRYRKTAIPTHLNIPHAAHRQLSIVICSFLSKSRKTIHQSTMAGSVATGLGASDGLSCLPSRQHMVGTVSRTQMSVLLHVSVTVMFVQNPFLPNDRGGAGHTGTETARPSKWTVNICTTNPSLSVRTNL